MIGITGAIVILVVVVIIFISPIAKYLIGKYDEKLTGRQITMSWLYLNPFTGYLHISNLKIFEKNSDSVFFSTDGLSANFEVLRLLSGRYEISSVTLTNPRGKVIRDSTRLNFTDVIEKFSKKDNSVPKKPAKPFKYKIKDIEIINGTFYYQEKGTPIGFFIKNFNLKSKGFSWQVDTFNAVFSFEQGTGSGKIKSDFTMNMKTLTYKLGVVINKFDLNIIKQYYDELSNYGNFTANLDADLKTTGSFKNQLQIDARGTIALNDFHFGKIPGDDYVSFPKLAVSIIQLNPKDKKYLFGTILLSNPFLKYEIYDSLDNITRMFGKGGSNITNVKADHGKFNLILELADYIKVLAQNFLHSDYKINKFSVVDANLLFNDYALSEKFSASLDPLNILADSVDKKDKRVVISARSVIRPYGNMAVTLSLDPKDNTNFDLNYKLEKVSCAMFNPYLIAYTSYPLDRGSIAINGQWTVRSGIINSTNHFIMIDPRTTKRVKTKGAKWIPVPLIMAFVRERGNVIDYEIPITGDIKDPKFRLHDIIIDLLTNIFVKPLTTGYRMEVKQIENEVEKSLRIKWKMRRVTLEDNQEDFLKKIIRFVKDNDKITLVIEPFQYEEKEKEHILFFEAKKKYFLAGKGNNLSSFSEDDSVTVDEMPLKDPAFLQYLNKHASDPMFFTVQQQCLKIVGEKKVDQCYADLIRQRENFFMAYFKEKGLGDRVKMGKVKSGIPFNGFSFFSINYKGDFPDDIRKAYKKLNELNEKTPRKKFQKEHKSTLEKTIKR